MRRSITAGAAAMLLVFGSEGTTLAQDDSGGVGVPDVWAEIPDAGLAITTPDDSNVDIRRRRNNEPVEYQRVRPEGVVADSGVECIWRSDYRYETQRVQVTALAFEITVTPSGSVCVRSTYPAEPLECPGM